MSKKTVLGLSVLGIIIGIGLSALYKNEGQVAEKKVVPKVQYTTDFLAKNVNNQEVRLSSLKGKPVVLHFWASWCPPCKDEIEEYKKVSSLEKWKSIQWLALSLDRNWEDARTLIDLSKLPSWSFVWLDTEGRGPELWGTYQFPESYFINSNFEVVAKWVGPQDWNSKEIQSSLMNLK